MSKPVFSHLFKFEGRRNRKSYFLYSLSFFGSGLFLVGISLRLPDVLGQLVLLLILPLMVSDFAVSTQRLRDLNLSGWWLLLRGIPVIGSVLSIYMFCKRGTHGDNRFDYDPLGKHIRADDVV